MEKYLLVGNGIDIQFGGYENYSNSAIMSRVIKNINSGKYVALTENSLNPKEQLEMLEQFVKIIDSIKAGGYKKYADGLFMLMELDRIKRTYPERSTIESVFLEDYFLAFETFNNSFKEKDGDEKSEFYRKVMFDFLQQIMVDCIFNDGKINDIHKNAPVGTKKFFEHFTQIFTTNYDIIHFLRREMLDFTAFPVFFVSNLLLVQRKKYYFNRATVSRNCSIVL